VGRPSGGGKFFYQSVSPLGADDSDNKWIRVELLAPEGANNTFGYGSQVTIRIPPTGPASLIQTQNIDGGSGRGGQASRKPTFGLGDTTEDVLITVTWPDGYVQSQVVPNGGLNTTVGFVDLHGPGLVDSSVLLYQEPAAGGLMDWVFEWETQYSTMPNLDSVWVQNSAPNPRGGAACIIGSTTLVPGDPDVDHSILPTATGTYRHQLRWKDRTCGAPCTFDYWVRSGVGLGGPPLPENRMEASSTKQFTVLMCMP